jgi:hypothetical protein
MQMHQLSTILKAWDALTPEQKMFVGYALRQEASETSVKVMKYRSMYTQPVKDFLFVVKESGVELRALAPAFY